MIFSAFSNTEFKQNIYEPKNSDINIRYNEHGRGCASKISIVTPVHGRNMIPYSVSLYDQTLRAQINDRFLQSKEWRWLWQTFPGINGGFLSDKYQSVASELGANMIYYICYTKWHHNSWRRRVSAVLVMELHTNIIGTEITIHDLLAQSDCHICIIVIYVAGQVTSIDVWLVRFFR